MPESDPNKHPSRRLRALKPSGYEPESYEEFYGADEQAELFDIMQGVRPEDRFSGKYGILPYLGYYGSGDPEDPAYGVSSINKYDIKNPEDLSQSILSGSAYFDTKRRFPRFERGDPDDPTVGGMLGWYTGSSIFPPNVPSTHDAVKENIRWVEGTGLPDPGESGISAYYPLQDFAPLVAGEITPWELDQELKAWDREVDLGDGAPENVYKPRFDPLSEDYYPFVSAEDMRTGKVDLEQPVWDRDVGFPSTVVHELTHRGFDTRAVRDFFDEMEDVGSFPEASGKTREWNRLHGGINPRLEHDIMRSRTWPPQRDTVIDPSGNYIDPDAPFLGWTTKTNPIETFQDQFLEWLTPEKQAKYGIDLPDAENLGFLGLQGGGPVSMANGGESPAWATPGINPSPGLMDVLNTRGVQAAELAQSQANAENALKYQWYGGWLPQVGANTSVGELWETLAPEPGTMGSPYSLWIMENIIMEALEGMQSTADWDADQISAFQDRIYDNLLAAAENEPDNEQLQGIATNINTLRGVETPTELTDDEKWEAWDEYLAAYEPSGDDNADIADAAEKAMEIFGKESDEAKEAFLVAAATYGVTTEQIADATGTTVAAILDNLPEISPIDYAKEAVTAVVEALKKADGSCIVGLGGSVTCDFTWGGQPPFGTGQQTGVPVWTIPGTNTTVGIDTGYNILNAVLGAISPAGAGRPWEDLPQIIYEAVLGQIKGTLSDKVKEEIYNAVLSVADSEGNIDIGVDLKKNCYNADGTITQVLAGQSCPTGTSETAPVVTTTTTTCYSDTDGSTVAALEDGTCPMGSSPTAPAAETDETRCVNSGGTWTDGACVCPTKSTLENGQCMAEAIGPGTTSKQGCEINADGTATGNTWNEDEQKCYGPAGTGPGEPEYTTCENIIDYNQSPDANGNYPTVTQNYLTADLPEGGCPTQFGTPPATTATGEDLCVSSGGTWTDGACVCPAKSTLENGQCMADPLGPGTTSKQGCEATEGNTWNEQEQKCYGPAGTDTRTSKEKCEANGDTWNEATQTCVTAGGLVNDDDKEGECKTKGVNFYWNRNNQTCVNRCPGGGLYNVAKDLCETTSTGTLPQNPDHTKCEGIIDYNQPAVNGVFPTVTQNYFAAEFAAIGGVCPTHFGMAPTDDDDCQIVDGVQYERNTLGVCVPPVVVDDDCQIVDGVQYVRNAQGVCGPPPVVNGLVCPTNAYDDDGVCKCTGGYSPTYSADGTLTACTKIEGPACPTNGEINAQGECVCKEGFSPVYTDGVLTACSKVGPPPGGCPTNASMVGGVCQCDDGYTPVYGDDGTLTACSPVGGDVCPANSTRNSAGNCVCDEGYQSSVDSDGLMTCVRFPVENCSNPAWAATHVLECSPCDDDDYAEANPQICGIKDGEPPTRPYATFEGVDMVRPPWVTPEDVRINRYPETEPSTYSILPAPAGSYEYGISSLARRPQDIREAVSVIDPGYEQLRGGPPVFTMEDLTGDPEEQARRRAISDKYYGAMDRLSDYSTQFNVGADELSESLGIPQEQFGWADVEYATPTYGTPPEGYPTSPDLQAAQDRPFYSPWLEEEEEEEESMFAHGGEVDEEPQGLESLLKRRQHAVDTMLVKRGRGNGVR